MKIKLKQCKQCGEFYKPFNTLQVVCSAICALEFNSKKEVDKRFKVMKSDSRSLIELRNLARVNFQIYIRQRDKDLPCISCNKSDAKWDAGHYLKAEIYTKLIFNEDNVHKQCSYCNLQLAGNLIEYRKNLVKRIGINKVQELEDMADLSRSYKFTKDELITLAKNYKLKIKK
jgi:hypothetical protein